MAIALALGSSRPDAMQAGLTPETAAHSPRLIGATKSALARLAEWLGPLPGHSLESIELDWYSRFAGASYPGTIVTSARLFEPESDRALERTVIAAVARHYWRVPDGSEPAQLWLGEGLALYTGVRAIHEELEGRHFATVRHFGGFVPFTSRSIQWSPSPEDPRPRLRQFAEVESPAGATQDQAQRVALSLHTLERYLGWPAMQQLMEALQVRWQAGPVTPADLADIATAQRGTGMQWFFDDALRLDAIVDYGIQDFHSDPSGLGYRTRVSLRRYGSGMFVGTSDVAAVAIGRARSLLVETRFEDGSVMSDWWDGRLADLELTYEGPSRAVATSVDPEAVLLLDADRSNNSRTALPAMTEAGARLVASWIVWLQDIMLGSTALL